MEKQHIQIKGIHRGIATGSLQDGFCSHLVNMRFKNDAWRLAAKKKPTGQNIGRTLSNARLTYIHPLIGNDYIFFTEFGSEHILNLHTFSGGGAIHTMLDEITDIQGFGRFLVILSKKGRSIFHINTDGSAPVITLMPDIPEPKMAVWDDERLPLNNQVVKTPNSTDFKANIKKAFFDDGLDGFFEGHVFFCLAYRLYDNTVIHHSTFHYFHVGLSSSRLIVHPLIGNEILYCSYYQVNKPVVRIDFTTNDIQALKKYRGIIKGMVVYMSKPVSAYAFDEEWQEMDIGGGFKQYAPKLRDATYNKYLFRNTSAMYKVMEYSLDDIINEWAGGADERFKIETITVKNIHSIETNEVMPIDNFTHHQLSGSFAYDYNSRLHIADTFTKIVQPRNVGRYYFSTGSSGIQHYNQKRALIYGNGFIPVMPPEWLIDYYIEVEIETEEGTRNVREHITLSNALSKGVVFYSSDSFSYKIYIRELITYPDVRAKKFRIVAIINGDECHNIINIPLQEHPFFNVAFYQNHVITSSSYTEHNSYIPPYVFDADVYYSTYTPPPIKNIINDSNRLQASALGNPFVYPAINSYRIGQKANRIKAMASMSSPMSEGQFGQFPIHVFTTSGIFNLNQGNADVLYTNIHRLNLDVLDDKNKLIELGGAVAYMSNNSLYLLLGSERKRISLTLETKQKQEQSDDNFGFPLNSPCASSIISENWNEFVNSYMVMAYDFNEQEIYLCNTDIEKTLCYHLPSGTWYLRDEGFRNFILDAEGRYIAVTENGDVYNINDETSDSDYTDHVCLITRPISFGVRGYKKVRRLIGNMIFDVVSGSSVMLSLYGSVNGREWELMRKLTFDNGINNMSINDLMIKETHGSAKYFIISFGAVVGIDFELTGFEAMVQQTFSRKLR